MSARISSYLEAIETLRDALYYIAKRIESKENEIACLRAALKENRDAVIKLDEVVYLVNTYSTDSWKYDSDHVNGLLMGLRRIIGSGGGLRAGMPGR